MLLAVVSSFVKCWFVLVCVCVFFVVLNSLNVVRLCVCCRFVYVHGVLMCVVSFLLSLVRLICLRLCVVVVCVESCVCHVVCFCCRVYN